MSPTLGPIDIACDAPPYPVVQASHQLGIQRPLDVCWLRLRNLPRRDTDPVEVVKELCKRFLGWKLPTQPRCRCGQTIPWLKKGIFAFTSGKEASYLLGQCPRCRTVLWDEC